MFGAGAKDVLFVSLVALLVFGPGRPRLDGARAGLAAADYPDGWSEGLDRQTEDPFDERPGD